MLQFWPLRNFLTLFRMQKLFHRIDVKTGILQIIVKSEDIEKTELNTNYSHFYYLVMRIEAFNAPEIFQSLLNAIYYDCLDESVLVYIDTILFSRKENESHCKLTKFIVNRLWENQLYACSGRSKFLREVIEYLGCLLVRKASR